MTHYSDQSLIISSQRSQTNLSGMSETTPLVGQIEADPVEAAQYRRYQYYTRWAYFFRYLPTELTYWYRYPVEAAQYCSYQQVLHQVGTYLTYLLVPTYLPT